ncbi:MAG: hypothetical protein GX684_04675 [Ruminococcaceae bacterium]|nr:hypothetical protein [Oscillospiraceae bacterium]
MKMKYVLHKEGHGPGHECCHHGHSCHSHAAGDCCSAPKLSPEQTATLLSYTLDHNRSHLDELSDISKALHEQGNEAASNLVHDAAHNFKHGVDNLAEALKLLKGE